MRYYIVKTINDFEFVPMVKVGTYPDVSYTKLDEPVLAPEAFWPFLSSKFVWSIALIDSNETPVVITRSEGVWIASAGLQYLWEDTNYGTLANKLMSAGFDLEWGD